MNGWGLWRRHHLFHTSMFYDFAVGEEDEVVTGGLGEANFVGDEDEFDAFVLGEGADFLEDVDGDFWVEGEVGSSRRRSLGWMAMARPIATRWRCPPESSAGRLLA